MLDFNMFYPPMIHEIPHINLRKNLLSKIHPLKLMLKMQWSQFSIIMKLYNIALCYSKKQLNYSARKHIMKSYMLIQILSSIINLLNDTRNSLHSL